MKRLKRCILFAFVLFSVFLIIKLFLVAVLENWIITYANQYNLNASDILTIISGIISSIFAFLVDYYFKYREEQADIRKEAPRINISTVREQAVTGKRKLKNCKSFQIELGEQQQEFRYVYAKIINTGQSTIVNCSIAKKSIPYQLNPQTEYSICFLIYEPLKQSVRRRYNIIYQIEDGKGKKYKGTYILKIDINEMKAVFYMKKKQKEV